MVSDALARQRGYYALVPKNGKDAKAMNLRGHTALFRIIGDR